jgi:hypothetical protein
LLRPEEPSQGLTRLWWFQPATPRPIPGYGGVTPDSRTCGSITAAWPARRPGVIGPPGLRDYGTTGLWAARTNLVTTPPASAVRHTFPPTTAVRHTFPPIKQATEQIICVPPQLESASQPVSLTRNLTGGQIIGDLSPARGVASGGCSPSVTTGGAAWRPHRVSAEDSPDCELAREETGNAREESRRPEGVIAKSKIEIAMAGRIGDFSRLLQALNLQVT